MEPRTRREERMLAAFGKEPPARVAHRGGRRAMVGAGAGCLALLWVNTAVSWVLAPSDTAMFTNFAVLGVFAPAAVFVWRTLSLATRGSTALPLHLLDERQRDERLRAHAVAQRLTLLLLFVTYFVVLQALRDDGVPSAAVALLFLALLATVAALPLLVAAWRAPDAPAEDDQDEDETSEGAGSPARS
ncbi:hypothetical protein ACFY4C_09280 [Actinomadura viridis]|uniref:hypothetical protein n=1 Tax=Actinomadura viridis TaxID=58110 RepID=UPI0036C75C45